MAYKRREILFTLKYEQEIGSEQYMSALFYPDEKSMVLGTALSSLWFLPSTTHRITGK